MWRRVTVQAAIDRPVEPVFAHLADPESWGRFVPAVVLRRRLDDGPVRAGSRWEAIDRIGPLRIHFVDELLELEPDRRVAWGSSAPWNARTEYVLEPSAGGTVIRATYEGDVRGWLRLLAWLPGPVVAWVLAKDFRRLEALLATSPSPDDERPLWSV